MTCNNKHKQVETTAYISMYNAPQ